MASDTHNSVNPQFRRNRMFANGLLAATALVTLGTHLVVDQGFAVRLVRAAAEAGLVGGLADWFAVTALFRRPLGLPIPHTAIIPRSKDRLADNLGTFVAENFLTRQTIQAKLTELDPAMRLADWMSRPANADLVADAVVTALPHLVLMMRSDEFRSLAVRLAGERLEQADITPIAVRILRALADSRELDRLFDAGISIMARLLQENREEVENAVRERSQWWIPGMIDKRIAKAIVEGAEEVVSKMRQPESEGRQRFRRAVLNLANELETSPDRRAALAHAKDRIIRHPEIKAWLGSMWDDLSQLVLEDAQSGPSRIRQTFADGVVTFGKILGDDAAMQAGIDRAVTRTSLYLVKWRAGIGRFFTDIVKNWDARTLSGRLENAVGSDLQYIRMNGTVVGALAGTGLFLLTELARTAIG